MPDDVCTRSMYVCRRTFYYIQYPVIIFFDSIRFTRLINRFDVVTNEKYNSNQCRRLIIRNGTRSTAVAATMMMMTATTAAAKEDQE